jgi:solute carrier family 25 (mitochondrial carnitine/acylcarnitine transporter), member 20/29
MFVNYGLARKVVASLGNTEPTNLSIAQYFACGIWTGFAVAFVESPVDNFKAKLQTQYGTGSGGTQYKGALDAASQIARQYGIRGVYQGLPATWSRNIPANFMYFGCYEIFKKMVHTRTLSLAE